MAAWLSAAYHLCFNWTQGSSPHIPALHTAYTLTCSYRQSKLCHIPSLFSYMLFGSTEHLLPLPRLREQAAAVEWVDGSSPHGISNRPKLLFHAGHASSRYCCIFYRLYMSLLYPFPNTAITSLGPPQHPSGLRLLEHISNLRAGIALQSLDFYTKRPLRKHGRRLPSFVIPPRATLNAFRPNLKNPHPHQHDYGIVPAVTR
ncbi:uncharacterized protein CLUP02_15347 [Colletotrichum lupini]|uniref:Uncharacterized protein n=1 Tax=Colletotrichum lupini TaxID=145971 RepID=A0A9Q8T848_9PEZI|nr:uncharacterized protein CLUP02_15347 [Colletotrichum lupini]UQC89816.1 hypothetical protein CLUP02_15347 [Colletotrichum lupini]